MPAYSRVACLQIHDVGGMALAKAAKNAVVLQTLNLGQNPIGNATITACADALRFSGALLHDLVYSCMSQCMYANVECCMRMSRCQSPAVPQAP
jgi:hypothetical protein